MNFNPVRRLGLLVLMIAVAGVVPVRPQTRSLPEAPGTWKPWKPFSACAPALHNSHRNHAATPSSMTPHSVVNAAFSKPPRYTIRSQGSMTGGGP
jgi:hypothetical protein